MSTMENSFVQLMDLPNEIIVMILKKLANVEVLYSLMDINRRLNKIIHNSIFTRNLNLIRPIDLTLREPYRLLDRFSFEILPQIHDQIQFLSVDTATMECFLLQGEYCHLRELAIFISDTKPPQYLTGKKSHFSLFF